MNERVKKRIQRMIELADRIKAEGEYIIETAQEAENDDDVFIIESAFDNVRRWALEGYDVCRNTYDEFEED